MGCPIRTAASVNSRQSLLQSVSPATIETLVFVGEGKRAGGNQGNQGVPLGEKGEGRNVAGCGEGELIEKSF